MPENDDGAIGPVGGAKAPGSVDEAPAAEAAAATEAVAAAESPDLAIAQALAAGELTPAQAQAQIIDEVVRGQLGPDATPEMIESVRAEVAAMLEDDPALLELLGR